MTKPGRQAGTYAQGERLLKLLEYLRGRQSGATSEELARHFEVSERQMRRDLNALRDAGNAFTEDKGDDGKRRVRLVDKEVRTIQLTRRERYTLLAVRRVFDVLEGTAFYEDIDSIYRKLADLLSKKEREELRLDESRFLYLPDGGRKPYKEDEAHSEVLDELLDGVLKRVRVAYVYEAPDGTRTEGTIDPYAIVLYKQGLYAIGPTQKPGAPPPVRPHVHAVERFVAAEATKESFAIPDGFSVSQFFDGAFGITVTDKRYHVVIDFAPKVRGLILGRVWHPTETKRDLPDGGVRLGLDLSSLSQIQSWVLSWGAQAKVIEPRSLVEGVREDLAAALAYYP